MSKQQSELIEYVYHPEKSPDDFQKVRISLDMLNDKLQISMEADDEMTKQDVETVLLYLQKASLNRRRISILDDCSVMVKVGAQKFAVKMAQDLVVESLTAVN